MEPIAEEPVTSLVPSPPVNVEDGQRKDARPLPLAQKQFNLLTQAFKGSAAHTPSPHGRKPSVLKLSKRVESEDVGDEKNGVTFASKDDEERAQFDKSGRLVQPISIRDPSEVFKSILKRRKARTTS